MRTAIRYRGISIYPKPGKRAKDPNNTKVAGEIYFGLTRSWVPQQDTAEEMLDSARAMIDAHLDKRMLIEDRWFRESLV